MKKLLNAMDVAYRVGVSVPTLNRWYGWWEWKKDKEVGTPELPKFNQYGKRRARYWTEEDVEKIKIFKSWIGKGMNGKMGEYNRRFWGDRNPELKKK